jgi:Fanconi anemia group M protein
LAEKFIKHPLIKKGTVEARIYQQLVYAQAIKGNTLFVAPTALGKTVLCVMVAAHRLHRVGGRVLVLAPTRPLVLQHARSFRKFMEVPPDQIMDFCGNVNPAERQELWPAATIAVATPQVVENDLKAGRLDLGSYSLVVFDEAHRSTGNYAYVPIAKSYRTGCTDPLVLALTASPGNKEEIIREVCDNLGIVNVEVKTDSDPDVKPYINPVEVDWRSVSLPQPFARALRGMKDYLDERFRSLRELGLVSSQYPTRKDLLAAGRVLGIGAEKFSSSFGKPTFMYYKALMDYATALKAEHALELLETQGVPQTVQYLERMGQEADAKGAPRSTKSFVKDPRITGIVDSLRQLSESGVTHPKMAKVEKLVRDELARDPRSRMIIFTNFRDSVELVVRRLSVDPRVRVKGFVGQSSVRSKGLSQKEQTRILDHFKEGRYNVLVATSVAEEGLDIAEVQLVLFYDCTPSAIRNIQRRGRTGRRGAGRVVILMAENTREEAYHWAGENRERMMRELLKRLNSDLGKRQLRIDTFAED